MSTRSVAKELTDPSKNRWGSEDVWTGAQIMHGVDQLETGGRQAPEQVRNGRIPGGPGMDRQAVRHGAVHPDAVAGNTQQAKQRFESGASLMTIDGMGGWHEALGPGPAQPTRSFQHAAHGLLRPRRRQAHPVPRLSPPPSSASSRRRTPRRSRKCWPWPTSSAAPFGTEENVLINNGVEGVHYTRDAQGVPQATAKGKAGSHQHLRVPGQPRRRELQVQYPGLVQTTVRTGKPARPRTWWRPSSTACRSRSPAKFGSLGKPFDDLAKDISAAARACRTLMRPSPPGRSNGGDELREFYAGFLNA